MTSLAAGFRNNTLINQPASSLPEKRRDTYQTARAFSKNPHPVFVAQSDPRRQEQQRGCGLGSHFERAQIGCRSVVRQTDVGAGIYQAAQLTAVIVLVVLILSRLEEHVALKRFEKKLVVRLNSSKESDIENIKRAIKAYGGKIKRITTDEEEMSVVFDIILYRSTHNKEIMQEITSFSEVDDAHWQ